MDNCRNEHDVGGAGDSDDDCDESGELDEFVRRMAASAPKSLTMHSGRSPALEQVCGHGRDCLFAINFTLRSWFGVVWCIVSSALALNMLHELWRQAGPVMRQPGDSGMTLWFALMLFASAILALALVYILVKCAECLGGDLWLLFYPDHVTRIRCLFGLVYWQSNINKSSVRAIRWTRSRRHKESWKLSLALFSRRGSRPLPLGDAQNTKWMGEIFSYWTGLPVIE